MFKEISVYNFKGLHKLENVKLDKITLIGGKNNAGKSSLLEAGFLYLDRKNPDMLNKQLMWRGLNNIPFHPSQLWGPFFYNFDFTKRLSIAMTDNEGKQGSLRIEYQKNYTPKNPVPVLITNNGAPLNSIDTKQFGALSLKHEVALVVDFDAHLMFNGPGMNFLVEKDTPSQIPIAVFESARNFSDGMDADRLGILDKEDEQDIVLEVLRMFEPQLQKLQVIKDGTAYVIYADFGNKKKVPINLLGDGFCRCLTITLILATNPNGILFLDETENGIHYSLLGMFWESVIKAVNFYKCQLIATTHSYEMIKTFGDTCKQKKFKDISYIRLAKQNEEVVAHQFSFDDLSAALASELEVR
jgi:AAA15 family ATPase/GTPase